MVPQVPSYGRKAAEMTTDTPCPTCASLRAERDWLRAEIEKPADALNARDAVIEADPRVMDADLTCPICEGTGDRVFNPTKRCVECHGEGRRRPTLAEWDALRAERDRCRRALVRIEDVDPRDARRIAGQALGGVGS